MNSARQEWLNKREDNDITLFERIKDNPKPDILDLWSLSEARFIEWRRIHDFPKLLAHFDKTLLLFKEWKEENKLTNEHVIEGGYFTPFLEHKKFSKKNNKLYLTKVKWGEKGEKIIVASEKIEGDKTRFGTIYNYTLIQEFTSYLDWLKSKNKKEEILNINIRQAPETEDERVWIHSDASNSDFELLKMGGIDVPVNGIGILFRGKKLEFVNLCGLKFQGRINFGEEGNLSCSYCACDNWQLSELHMELLNLDHCSLQKLMSTNSVIKQWKIYDCKTNGELINTKIYFTTIFGGSFNAILQNCVLENTDIIDEDKNIINDNLFAYKSFKKIYLDQGDDKIAQDYYVKENELIRHHLKGWKYITKSLSYHYWEYGSKPHRIIYYSILSIFLFAFIYWLNPNLISQNSSNQLNHLFNSLYFSTVTYTTLGYGDINPKGFLKVIASIEALFGVINTGFLIAGYTNNKY